MLEKFSFDSDSAFFSIISQGNLNDVKNFFNSNPEMINKKDKNLYTPVSLAVVLGKVEVYTFLRNSGADVNMTYSQDNMEEISVMHIAASCGKLNMVETLLKDGANVNAVIKNTRILPISLAVGNGHLEIAKYLIRHDSMPHLEFPVPFNASEKSMKFFQDQIQYRARQDWDGIMRDFYHDEAQMISFDFVLHGKEEIKKHFIEGNRDAGKLIAFSIDHYAESENVIIMRSSVLSENTLTKANDSYYFVDGKVYLFTALTKAEGWADLTKEWALKWMFK